MLGSGGGRSDTMLGNMLMRAVIESRARGAVVKALLWYRINGTLAV